ncbi:FimV/HubP family polar landmark protein [Paraburkholderia lacunae]|uniref:Fimbrial protein FimV n=1 Tax=Paraburkholderia lacunae TaxID=2211104 RepID=A0A370N421_9BURK|nr:FimV/HubP family polar landmark protein [Paraburkholderia lacunae]RDK00198.1 fimbrial protein FimV [Paraburkholderia lacunae]
MNLRLSSLRAMFIHHGAGRLAAAAALAFALAGAVVGAGSAVAATVDAASAPQGASAATATSYAAGSQYTVRPGQSLNDVAIAVTQSHDRATLARASRALFDANPNAFMSHDPSRMRMGAVLTVPALDASGALVAASASVGSAAVAASAPAAAPVSASSAATAVGAASGVAQVNAAAASAASAAARVAAPATPVVTGAAGAASQTNGAMAGASGVSAGGAAVAGAASSVALTAGASATASSALPGSGAHAWSGSIQASASESAEGASALAAPASSAAQPASQAHTQVSSLQQLLALKNRVLMELQKHGIGGSTKATGTASTGMQPPVGASSAAAVAGHSGAAISTSNESGISQANLSVAAAVGAALVALLAALRLRRRKRERIAATDAAPTDEVTASERAAGAQEIVSTHEQSPVSEPTDVSDDVVTLGAAALAAEREAEQRRVAASESEAAERQAAARAEAERAEAERAEAERAEAESAAAEREAAQREAAAHGAAEREAAAHQPDTTSTPLAAQEFTASEHPWQDGRSAPVLAEPAQPTPDVLPAAHSDFTSEPVPPAHHENFDGATTAASLAAAAELGAEALPATPLEPVSEVLRQEQPLHRLQWEDKLPAPLTQPHDDPHAPQPAIDLTQQPVEPYATSPSGQPSSDASAHPAAATPFPQQDASPATAPHFEPAPVTQAQPAPTALTEFPRDAVDAFGSLNMPLPPRVESTAGAENDDAHALQPLLPPETSAPHDPDDARPITDEIASGVAGPATLAGLGAAGFGALKLDFDLELPPSPALPLPAFTQADLARIARNKLDLAAEYIDLGDLSGARALINEVIEANDPATRTEARALLSTLAPLS